MERSYVSPLMAEFPGISGWKGLCTGIKTKGGKVMKKNGVSLVEFVQEDRFELSSYITSLFNKLNDYVPKSLKDKRWMTIKNDQEDMP